MSERHSDIPGAPFRGEVEARHDDRTDGPAEGGESAESVVSGPPSAEETAALLKQLKVGTVIDGKYRIDDIIGKGAMGVVLGATHVHLKERVALKFLSTRPHADADKTSDFHSRFRREAIVSAKLRNEHITRVIDVGVWSEHIPFMVMDLLVGDDLRRTLKSAPGGKLSPAVALDYTVQICEGLAEAHSHGIVHRDLKPSNLFVTKRQDGTDLIKILDFGISKWSSNEEQIEELTQTGVVLGSPKYMSPEQLFGSASVDARADVWSIGAILYEMLTSRPPFDFPTLTRICAELAADRPPPSLKTFDPDLPAELEAVLMQCFARDREHRVQNVAELAGALLESVEAPFAGQVRQKITAMLDPKGQMSPTVTSSGGLAVTNTSYRSLSMTGSTPGATSSSGALRLRPVADGVPPSATTAGGVEAPLSAEAPATARRKGLAIAAFAGAIVVVALLAFAFAGGRPQATGARGEQTTAASAVLVAQPPPVASAAPTPAVTATAPSSGSAPTPPLTPAPTATPAPAALAPVPRTHGGHHNNAQPRPSPQAPPPVAAAPPPPPPTPAPAPTPAPTKANPLEDRQ